MSSITEIKHREDFVAWHDKEYRTRLNTGLRGMRNPDVFYVVHITGKNATKLEAWADMIDWCLDNVTEVPKVRTEFCAVTSIATYMFLKHADALAFFFRFGSEYE